MTVTSLVGENGNVTHCEESSAVSAECNEYLNSGVLIQPDESGKVSFAEVSFRAFSKLQMTTQ